MPNRCVIDGKLRFEFARDLEQTIFHAFTLVHFSLFGITSGQRAMIAEKIADLPEKEVDLRSIFLLSE